MSTDVDTAVISSEVMFAIERGMNVFLITDDRSRARFARVTTIRGAAPRYEYAASPAGPWARYLVGEDTDRVVDAVVKAHAALPKIRTVDAYP